MKYELTTNTRLLFGRKLYQIKALITFSNVIKGELGGWVEADKNLDHEGDAWVYGNALVSGNARVYGNAWVYGDALVSGNALVYGDARVSGNARVYGNARVSGNALVSGNARFQPITISGLAYEITITDRHIRIGCEFHKIKEWDKFSNKRILEMDGKDALKFWKANKYYIIGITKATGRPFKKEGKQ